MTPDHLSEPRLYGEKVPNRLIAPRLRRVQRRIVMLHDFFRTKVVPPAANMLSMVSTRMSRSFSSLCHKLEAVLWRHSNAPRGRMALMTAREIGDYHEIKWPVMFSNLSVCLSLCGNRSPKMRLPVDIVNWHLITWRQRQVHICQVVQKRRSQINS